MLMKAYLLKGGSFLFQRHRDDSNRDYTHKSLPKVEWRHVHMMCKHTNRCLGTRGFEREMDKILREFRVRKDSLQLGIREGLGEEVYLTGS